MKKIDPRIKVLDSEYAFYQYLDDQERPLLGQYFAVKKGNSRPSTNGTTVQDAVVKKAHRPNPDVEEGLMNSAFYTSKTKVDAATVQDQHPKLISFLLRYQLDKSS